MHEVNSLKIKLFFRENSMSMKSFIVFENQIKFCLLVFVFNTLYIFLVSQFICFDINFLLPTTEPTNICNFPNKINFFY